MTGDKRRAGGRAVDKTTRDSDEGEHRETKKATRGTGQQNMRHSIQHTTIHNTYLDDEVLSLVVLADVLGEEGSGQHTRRHRH